MLIKNKSKGKIIARDAILLTDLFSKTKGLMFSGPKTLIFEFNKEKAIALHMLFVFFPIDVLFLDKKKNVIDKKENFLPFTFYSSKRKAMYAIELENGAIRRTKTRVGDKIEFY